MFQFIKFLFSNLFNRNAKIIAEVFDSNAEKEYDNYLIRCVKTGEKPFSFLEWLNYKNLDS